MESNNSLASQSWIYSISVLNTSISNMGYDPYLISHNADKPMEKINEMTW